MKKAVLVLEDGFFLEGELLGASGETFGEVCFNTGMTGYQEIITDPSYCRQIVIMTAPHIGNYGVNVNNIESDKVQISGFVIKEETEVPSNWGSEGSIGEYLRKNNITGIKRVDTRAIVSHIRDNGAMNGIITSNKNSVSSILKKLDNSSSMLGLDLAKQVTCLRPYLFSEKDNNGEFRIAVIDYGIKKNILRLLNQYNCNIQVFPATTSSEEVKEYAPDGVFLSNGPGDPAAVTYGIDTVKSLLGKVPIFGICLGHQILALALGGRTFKLKFGHRGINHPVKNLFNNKIEITSQNHGFAVDIDSLPSNTIPTHINLNDNTLAGLKCPDLLAFSVQFHPEASPGPHDSSYLFKDFISLIKDAKKN